MKIFRIFAGLSLNYFRDYLLYIRHSGTFSTNNETKTLAYITYFYHGIEKGLSMPSFRFGFGKQKIKNLLKFVFLYIDKNYDSSKSQFIAGSSVLKKYYDIHKTQDFSIEEYFTSKAYEIISLYAKNDIGGALVLKKESYFKPDFLSFEEFVKSRHSIRYFSLQQVEKEKVKKAVALANHCPSACNRQSSKAYLINNTELVQAILAIQKGVLATADQIKQLIVVTSNRNYFFTSGERIQFYIDGGIFIESLILSLHSLSIASCTAHWSLNNMHDKQIKKLIKLSEGEKVIALLVIGYLPERIKIPASYRKPIEEIFEERP